MDTPILYCSISCWIKECDVKGPHRFESAIITVNTMRPDFTVEQWIDNLLESGTYGTTIVIEQSLEPSYAVEREVHCRKAPDEPYGPYWTTSVVETVEGPRW